MLKNYIYLISFVPKCSGFIEYNVLRVYDIGTAHVPKGQRSKATTDIFAVKQSASIFYSFSIKYVPISLRLYIIMSLDRD